MNRENAMRASVGAKPREGLGRAVAPGARMGFAALAILILAVLLPLAGVGSAMAQNPARPPTDRHVGELAAFLDRVQIAEPAGYRNLAVYPILLERPIDLPGRWLTLDEAVARGALVVTEKGDGGSVPVVVVENRSRDANVFIMSGEVLSGGKQTRTVRQDVALVPGQRVELSVFCVEARRWGGDKNFSASGMALPQSIQKEMRRGADQDRIWAEVARNNQTLGAENATGNLESALRSRDVREKLDAARGAIVPRMPRETTGYIFTSGGRALGAAMFGSPELAAALLPKVLDSYAVDVVIIYPTPRGERPAPEGDARGFPPGDHRAAIAFFERVCRAGSRRAETPGSGEGIRTRADGLLGDGLTIRGATVHYGVQVEQRIVPLEK